MSKTRLVIFHTPTWLLHSPDREQLSDSLLADNQGLMLHEKESLGGYNHVILAEMRPPNDRKLQRKFVLPILQHHFANLLQKTHVTFDPFWFVTNDSAKSNMQAIASQQSIEPWNQEMLNASGITDIIALAHRAAASQPGVPLSIQVYAQDADKADAIANFFDSYPNLLPKEVYELRWAYQQDGQVKLNNAPLNSEGSVNHLFDTTDMHTTATAWANKSIIPGNMLATRDRTLELLGAKPTVEVAEAPSSSTAVSSSTTTNTTTTEDDGKVVYLEQFSPKNKMFLQNYINGKFSLEDYLKSRTAIYNTNEVEPDETQLVQLILKIANLAIWEEKGHSAWSLATGSYTPFSMYKTADSTTAPTGITTIRGKANKKHVTLGELAEVVNSRPQAQSTFGFLGAAKTRSRTTEGFYELLKLLPKSRLPLDEKTNTNIALDNFGKLHAIQSFCKKFKIDYRMLTSVPAAPRSFF